MHCDRVNVSLPHSMLVIDEENNSCFELLYECTNKMLNDKKFMMLNFIAFDFFYFNSLGIEQLK